MTMNDAWLEAMAAPEAAGGKERAVVPPAGPAQRGREGRQERVRACAEGGRDGTAALAELKEAVERDSSLQADLIARIEELAGKVDEMASAQERAEEQRQGNTEALARYLADKLDPDLAPAAAAAPSGPDAEPGGRKRRKESRQGKGAVKFTVFCAVFVVAALAVFGYAASCFLNAVFPVSGGGI